MIHIKTKEQIDGIRKSCQLARDALQLTGSLVQPGIKTIDIADQVYDFIISRGGNSATLGYKDFPGACCISVNDTICHGIPGENMLNEGDIISIDITTILDGYFGDTCATFPVGKVKNKVQKLIDATQIAMMKGIEVAQPGNHFGDIGYRIGRYIKGKCYSIVRDFCGHGVGLEFHEEPSVMHIARHHEGPEILPGMIFTIEPMINEGVSGIVIDEDGWTARTQDGKLSAQFEHTILITETCNEILTM